jgi:hypothetical protein
MLTHPEKHFKETKRLSQKIDPKKVASWLLNEGYYPEQYVLPPCFDVGKFKLRKNVYFKPKPTKRGAEFKPPISDLVTVSFPKSQLTEKTFGIIEPKIYHDITWLLTNEWKMITNHLFHKDIKIYSYSFPIPVTKKNDASLSDLRAGRLIYEFLEMSENDLVAEAHKYKYILKTDVKNFYPNIYTHSITWALHTKVCARADRSKYALLGTKLDKLLQNANDGRTNGIPIGSAISDLIAEILMAAIDRDTSNDLKKRGVTFLGVRFKDDYRFLCHTESDASAIIKTLQTKLKDYNLILNEGKTVLKELPEGLFREWVPEYNRITLRYKKNVVYKQFEQTLLAYSKFLPNYFFRQHVLEHMVIVF